MNLFDLKTPLHLLSIEDATIFIRNLRHHRSLDNSPPKKEKKGRVLKEKKTKGILDLTPAQMELFLSLLEKEKNNE